MPAIQQGAEPNAPSARALAGDQVADAGLNVATGELTSVAAAEDVDTPTVWHEPTKEKTMPNQPPLNPDALEAVAHERYEARRSFEGLPPWEDLLERNRKAEIRGLGNIVSAYLAAAQPEVNSVEELDALPAGTLVRAGGREFYKTSYIDLPWILPYGVDRFASGYLAKHSKLTVTHRPGMNDA
ncbi:hypothetical protein [Glutamicibacter nicotianae]|uniref:hypothetical protein n=1 Tax=Glutamicibacter nicotianae TaxID=37929 RepID=UPI001957B792|nr:hypothetical protein [Glutamicibacter nicotianae]MBM7767340.1 hypothetical protein [Glutamicibacter nicotianae]